MWDGGLPTRRAYRIRDSFALRVDNEAPSVRSALSGEVGTRVRDLIRDNVTDEVIAKYIAEQNIDQDEDFRVDG